MEYLWEAKNLVNKVKHAVLNLTEMESKVMTATNDETWGASSTLMLEISRGTFHFQQFNEIMNIIVKRLSEREPHNWRKIYKALTLLEYLIKNGSEKVIDFARDKISLIKSLRSFNYIDEKNKDQGINVKTRAKEIVELLGSTERIKEERKKAKANRTKYVGIGSEPSGFGAGGGFGSSSSSSSRFGNGFSSTGASSSRFGNGFAREELGGGLDFSDEPSRSHFDDVPRTQASERARKTQSSSADMRSKPEPPLPAAPIIDLFSFDDPPPISSQSQPFEAKEDEWSSFQGPSKNIDDFGDFQSVTVPSKLPNFPPPSNDSSTTVPKPSVSNQNLFDFGDFNNSAPPKPPHQNQNGLSQFTSTQSMNPASNNVVNNPPKSTNSDPANLWSQHADILSLDSLSIGTNNTSNTRSAPLSMNQMASKQTSFTPAPQPLPKTTTSSFPLSMPQSQNNPASRPLNPVDLSEFDSLI